MKLKIMTANIWGDYFGNPVDVREDGIFEVIEEYSPCVVGFQEVTKGWHESRLFTGALRKAYRFVGTETDGCENYVPFIFGKDIGFSYISKGYELLENTPDLSKAITWAVFKSKEGDVRFAVCNTHFWWKTGPEHDIVREQNAKQLANLMKNLHERYSCPVFAFGDMNCTRSSSVFDIYASYGIVHLSDIAQSVYGTASCHGDPVLGEDGKYHGKVDTRPIECSIDHIVVLGDVNVLEYKIIDDKCVLDSTDHSPVMATVEL